ncbi:LysR family transcriptional regulator [Roseateles toxinivorans]|uniref:LysR family transcriptional regulator n=1 Tax=Roseateles toxinivorans TaxID=270368 RepID=A0A4R6QS20_9BURK|nr:LysR family transcriptional regulator [Roseateles toxinivorans]TDP72938.1 LysR family transcriptional regulator [Roseateles toxinivorans]
MDHLDSLRSFVAVAEAQGFSAAARRLGVSAPAMTRAIAALEQRLGVLLLQRSTRSVRLTDTGERFVHDCRRILADLDEAEGAASGVQTEARGMLAITAPQMFGRLHVAAIAQDFLHQHPRVQLRTLFADRLVNLLDEGMDVALRIAHLPDSGLTALQLGSLRRVVVASPDYLARHGRPQQPQDLTQHRAIGFSFDGVVAQPWQFGSGRGQQTVTPTIDWVCNLSDVAIGAALAGQGLTRCLAYQAAEYLRSGALTIVLAEFEPPPVPVHIVYPAGRRAPAKVRAFVDFAAERLRREPILQGGGLEPASGPAPQGGLRPS